MVACSNPVQDLVVNLTALVGDEVQMTSQTQATQAHFSMYIEPSIMESNTQYLLNKSSFIGKESMLYNALRTYFNTSS